jgi:hypothetical protein
MQTTCTNASQSITEIMLLEYRYADSYSKAEQLHVRLQVSGRIARHPAHLVAETMTGIALGRGGLTWKQRILNFQMGPNVSDRAVFRRWGCFEYAISM